LFRPIACRVKYISNNPFYHTQSVISLWYTIIPDLQRLKAVMEQRAKAFVNYRHFIAIRAKFFFQMMLSQRGYNGKMSFDHGSEILGLQVRLILLFYSKMMLK